MDRWVLIMRRFRCATLAAVAVIGFGSVASAADMPVKAPAYKAPAAVAPSWTGFYVGVNIGGGWGSRSVDYSPNDVVSIFLFDPAGGTGAPPSASFTSSGVIGGLQLGYNWQFNHNWLVGIETDFDWSGIKGSGSSSGLVNGLSPFTASVEERVKWFGTVRARLGYLPMDSLLAYITGGFAYGRVDQSGKYVNSNLVGGDGQLALAGLALLVS